MGVSYQENVRTKFHTSKDNQPLQIVQDQHLDEELQIPSPIAPITDIREEVGKESKVRKMRNDDWSIPFACGWNIIKVDNFDAFSSCLNVHAEQIIYMKFTGCPAMEHVIEWCSDNLQCRVNDEEMHLVDPVRRPGRWKLQKSKGNDSELYDILRCKVFIDEKFKCSF